MSWLDKVKTQLMIQTGDSKEYRPSYINASKTRDYNTAEFDFPEVAGTLVTRKKPRGTKYNLFIYFQGDDHLDTSSDFVASADDPRPWTVTHPLYGRILVQPTTLDIDNSQYNVTEVKCTIVETILESYPKGSLVPQDKIAADVEACNESLATSVVTQVETNGIKPQSINKSRAVVSVTDTTASSIISAEDDVQQYYNSLATARSKVNNFGDEPLDAMQSVQELIMTTAEFQASVTDRVNNLATSYANMGVQMLKLPILLADKVLYQSLAATVLNAMCLAASKPLATDYANRTDVLAIADIIQDNYDDYLENLDSIQSDNGGSPDSFIPDATSLQQLDQLIGFTVSNLFNIALNARQERSIILEYDSNWIILAHRFYGLNADDSTVDQLMNQNKAGLHNMLQVRKNQRIVYYI